MSIVGELKEKVENGGAISREEALELYEAPLEELCRAAEECSK